jgi:hypothetical protein
LVANGAKTDYLVDSEKSIFHDVFGLPEYLRKEVLQLLLKNTFSIKALTIRSPLLGEPVEYSRARGDFENAQLIEDRIKELRQKPKATMKNQDPKPQTHVTNKSASQQASVTQGHKATSTMTVVT